MGLVHIFSNMDYLSSSKNGVIPTTISYKTAPKLHQSQVLSCPFLSLTISGARYSGVPQQLWASYYEFNTCLDNPKSASLT